MMASCEPKTEPGCERSCSSPSFRVVDDARVWTVTRTHKNTADSAPFGTQDAIQNSFHDPSAYVGVADCIGLSTTAMVSRVQRCDGVRHTSAMSSKTIFA